MTILEGAVHQQLHEFLSENKLLTPNQFGFRPKLSTVMPIHTNIHTYQFSGTNQKPERRRPFGTGLVRHCPQGLFPPFFTFLRALFFRPFRLSLVPFIRPWVSEDARGLDHNSNIFRNSNIHSYNTRRRGGVGWQVSPRIV